MQSRTKPARPAPRPAFHPETVLAGLRYARKHGVRAALSRAVRRLSPKPPYAAWIERYDTVTEQDRAAIVAHIAALRDRPVISIAMPVYNTKIEFLRQAIDSVIAQIYPHWELCIADDASPDPAIRPLLQAYARRDDRIKIAVRLKNGNIAAASNSALELTTGDFIALMDHDDVLPPHALYMAAVELNAHPDADLIYSDEDKIDAAGQRHDPYFKPDWGPELFYSQNMVSHLGIYRAALVRAIGGFREGYEGSQDYDLALRISARTTPERIRHIPHILYHWRLSRGVRTFSTDHLPLTIDAAKRALNDHLAATGERAEVHDAAIPMHWRVRRPVPQPVPRVSLIVPTRDRIELLRPCIEGLLHRTRYPELDIIIVDNESREPATLAYFAELAAERRVRVLRSPGAFNFSALNNRAATLAEGELIGLVNNDIDVIEPGWLEEMVSQAAQPGVGAVGAKLYYSDDTVQHAGVVLGLGGVAGHWFRDAPRTAPGYFGQLCLLRNVSCVTAACMLVWKKVFDQVGGLDEVDLQVAFNDLDLCLKIREAGYRLIWTPYAELYHRESASRGSDLVPAQIKRFNREISVIRQRWGHLLDGDPFFSPNLALDDENFSLVFPPRVRKPWERFKGRNRPAAH